MASDGLGQEYRSLARRDLRNTKNSHYREWEVVEKVRDTVQSSEVLVALAVRNSRRRFFRLKSEPRSTFCHPRGEGQDYLIQGG